MRPAFFSSLRSPSFLQKSTASSQEAHSTGKRLVLSPATLAYMSSNQLSAAVTRTALYLPGTGYGFGLGFAVRTSAGEAANASSLGEITWGGAGGTYWWLDPGYDMFVVFMMQSPAQRAPYRAILRNMVYGAITEARLPASR